MPVGLDPGGLEHRGPVDPVRLQDVLGNEVLGGPEGLEIFAVRIARSGNIIDQGVEPDVGYIVVVKGSSMPQVSRVLGREMHRSSRGSRRKASTSFL